MVEITLKFKEDELLEKKVVKVSDDGRIFIGRKYAGQRVVVYVFKGGKSEGQ